MDCYFLSLAFVAVQSTKQVRVYRTTKHTQTAKSCEFAFRSPRSLCNFSSKWLMKISPSCCIVSSMAFAETLALSYTPMVETPPPTPSKGNAPTIGRGLLLDVSPRTPRKPRQPQQAATPDCFDDSAFLRFEFACTPPHSVPTALKIHLSSAEKRSRSLSERFKSRRRLWTRDCNDSAGFSQLYNDRSSPPPRKRPRRDIGPALGGRLSPTLSGPRYADDTDATDADDEMEGASPKVTHLSPPLSPRRSRTSSPIVRAHSSEAVTQTRLSRAAPTHARPSSAATVSDRKSSYGGRIKICASCKTRKTPLWRDSEDGTPYCNACGIRFKKYHVRCSSCLYIPRKDEKTGNVCCICGARLVQCRFR